MLFDWESTVVKSDSDALFLWIRKELKLFSRMIHTCYVHSVIHVHTYVCVLTDVYACTCMHACCRRTAENMRKNAHACVLACVVMHRELQGRIEWKIFWILRFGMCLSVCIRVRPTTVCAARHFGNLHVNNVTGHARTVHACSGPTSLKTVF